MNDDVRQFWEQEACGTGKLIVRDTSPYTRDWFEHIEIHRYLAEPCIHSTAQFTRYHGKRVLEIGVGAGTDHLQWARAGAECYGVDLTHRAIEITRARFQMYGFKSELQQIDAELLPFPSHSFDVVYSWGVIHHSANPERIITEIRRVLKPQGLFLGMMYGRHSLVALKLWMKFALLRGKPWRTLRHVIAHHMESPGTKAYTYRELKGLFSEFCHVEATPILTCYDCKNVPSWICQWIPARFGWFISLKAVK
jgi:ubiquinone/menaquinone biosynthesis C-methylase UbiE